MINRFPNERVNNFSDAIFAIAITLLVLEVKVPTAQDLAQFGTAGVLGRLATSFISLFISFVVTALYWRSHLSMAQFVRAYDNRLLWLNLWLLLFVVLLPFSTGFYAKNFNQDGPFIFYCFNLVAIGVFNYGMVRHIIRTHGVDDHLTPTISKWFILRAWVAPVVWLFSAAITPLAPTLARFAFIGIFVIYAIGEHRLKKREAQPTKK
jgi:uncharacterized membrane protein